MDNNYKDFHVVGPLRELMPKGPSTPGLCPTRHKEFNEFIKGKGFKGRNNYKLKDLKAMFGFKPMITGSPVMISAMQGPYSDELELRRFDSMSKVSTSTGIPYVTLLYAKRNSKDRVKSNEKEYSIIFHQLKMPHSNFKSRATEFRGLAGALRSLGALPQVPMQPLCDPMHRKFCSKPPVAFDKVEVPTKAMTMGSLQGPWETDSLMSPQGLGRSPMSMKG